MSINYSTVVHLNRGVDAHDDRVALSAVSELPAGARLVVHVGNRRMATADAVAWLRHASSRLHVEIEASTPEALTVWKRAVEAGVLA